MHGEPLSKRSRRSRGRSAVAVALILAAVGCGSDDDSDASGTTDPSDAAADVVPEDVNVTTIEEGSGSAAAPGDYVAVRYTGTRAEDGEEFDSNHDHDRPLAVTLGSGQVIQGFNDGLVGARLGEVRQIDIPAVLAYGEVTDDAPDDGPPLGDLTFVVDVEVLVARPDVVDVADPTSDVAELSVDDVSEGVDDPATVGDTVELHVLLAQADDLDVFFSTWDEGQTAVFMLEAADGPLAGLYDGIVGMRRGGRRLVTIPAALAFGDEGAEEFGLPPGTDLIAVIDLVDLAPGAAQPPAEES